MKEITGELWEQTDSVICVTTNGIVRNDGCCVMGRGCALEAKMRFPGIDKILGDRIKRFGNKSYLLGTYKTASNTEMTIVSFPTKHNYKDKSDIELIKQSIKTLIELTNTNQWKKVVIPRPGCGSGWLQWSEVKKEIEPLLDDRFYIISNDKI